MFVLAYVRAMAGRARESAGSIEKVTGLLVPVGLAAAGAGILPFTDNDIANAAIGFGVGAFSGSYSCS